MSLTVVKNATCTFCGCVCDDIELHADDDAHRQDEAGLQSSATAWFLNHTAEQLYPDALIDGKQATRRRGDRSGGRVLCTTPTCRWSTA